MNFEMSLKFLPLDIKLHIWSFVETNKCSLALLHTCKEISKIGIKFGYLKNLTVRYDTDMIDFMNMCFRHQKSLSKIKIYNMDDPHNWIPIKWPRTVVFSRCHFNKKAISAPKGSVTEHLIITSCKMYNEKTTDVNWGSLPKLKKITIKNHNVNLVGLEQMINL